MNNEKRLEKNTRAGALFVEKDASWHEKLLRDRGFRNRDFEVVLDEHRQHKGEIVLPRRSDPRSAGYDFYTPIDFTVPANSKFNLFTDIKAYMLDNEFLSLVPRSSIGTKLDTVFANTIGIIDSSYYENSKNDGNIGICFRNMGDKDVSFKKGERVAQGIFMNYLTTDNDDPIKEERTGGYGSSGK